MNKKRIVITGMGVVSPNGIGIDEFSISLKNGNSGIKVYEEAQNLNFRGRIAGVPPLSPDVIKEKLPKMLSAVLTNNGIIYAALAGLEAWEMAGLPISEDVNYNAGMVFGSGSVGVDLFSKDVYSKINEGVNWKLGSTIVPQSMNSGPSAYLNLVLGIGGPVISNSAACATGTESLLFAYNMLQYSSLDRVLAGSSEGIGRYIWGSFDSMRILCADSNENPTFGSRPMHATSSGFVPSGGAGALVLETLDSALKRNAPIYAEILGGAQNSGGLRNGGSMTAANPTAASLCIQEAIDQAGISTEEIDLISGHLTSTKADPSEIKIWKNVWGNTKFPIINAPKSMTGHCIGAAGSLESVACVLQIHENYIHQNINLTDETIHPDILAEISSDRILFDSQKLTPKTVIKGSFGFGDVNCCIIFKKFEP